MPSILARIHCLHFSHRLFGSSLKCVVYLQQSERSDHLGAARTLAVVRCHQPVLSLHRSACKSLSLSDIRCCRAFCSRREWGRVPHKWARGGIPPPCDNDLRWHFEIMHEIWLFDSQKNYQICCHQMSDFKAKMHQIRIRLRLRPQTPLGELTALPQPP